MGKVKYDKKTRQLRFLKTADLVGMEYITESGIACYKKQYTVLYAIVGTLSKSFPILRFYNLRFQLLFDEKEKNVYLILLETYDSLEQAEQDLALLETDMQKNFPCTLKRLDLSARMSLLHRMSTGGAAYLNVENYTKEGDWLQELCLKRIKEENEFLTFGSKGNTYVQISSVKDPYLWIHKEAFEIEGSYWLLDFAPVLDAGVKQFMEETYLGLERLEKRIQNTQKELYEVLFQPQKEEQCRFTLFGLSLVRIMGQPQFPPLDPHLFSVCYGLQKPMLQSLLPNAKFDLSQMRVCTSRYAASVWDSFLQERGQETWYLQEKNL